MFKNNFRIILKKLLSITLMISIVIFFAFNNVKTINILSYQNREATIYNKEIDYHNWNGNLDFQPLDKIVQYSNDNHLNILSFTKVEELVKSNSEFDVIKANEIKENLIIRIDSEREFQRFSRLANSSVQEEKLFYLSNNYILGKDLDYSKYPGMIIYPIGNNDYPFIGSFNGQGFEIKNLMLADEEEILEFYNPDPTVIDYSLFPNLSHYALFGKVGTEGLITKIGLINPILRISYYRPQLPTFPVDMTHAAGLVGVNEGEVSFVYLIDDREYLNGGYDVRGGFKVSGIIAENYGYFHNAYFSGATNIYIIAKQKALYKPVVYENHGLIEEVFFDSDIYLDEVTDVANVIGMSSIQLITQDNCLNNPIWKSSDFRQYDPNTLPSYPKLIGILDGSGNDNDPYLIQTPLDLISFSKMIDMSEVFRDKIYRLNNCINMNLLSPSAYQPPQASFSGIFDGEICDTTNCLYEHIEGNNNHAIINFNLSSGIQIENNYDVGLFTLLSGTVKNINFINGEISNLEETAKFRGYRYNIGVLAARAHEARIENVHTNTYINLNNKDQMMGVINAGGLIGSGSVIITNSSNSGDIDGGVFQYINDLRFTLEHQTIGGIIGNATDGSKISNVINSGNIKGVSYTDYNLANPKRKEVLIGGISGNISSSEFNRVLNIGDITSKNIDLSTVDGALIGGIFGKYSLHKGGYGTRYSLYNKGDLYINKGSNDVIVAGIGITNYYDSQIDNLVYLGLVNEGTIVEDTTSYNYSYQMAGLLFDLNSDAILYKSYNYANYALKMGRTKKVSPLYDSVYNENFSENAIIHSANYGNLNILIEASSTSDIIITGISASRNVSLKNVFNYGDITVLNTFNLANINLRISGLINEVGFSNLIIDSHNEGDIKLNSSNGNYKQYLGGITTRVASEIIDNEISFGVIKNSTNNGLIQVLTNNNNETIVGGIVCINQGLVKDGANLNDIAVSNTRDTTDENLRIIIGGVAGFNNSDTSQLLDIVNYGNLYSRGPRYMMVGGLLGYAEHRLSSIKYGINYGDVFSWAFKGAALRGNINNFTDGMLQGLHPSAYASSGGIVGFGLSTTTNVINKGIISSNDVAGGIIGTLRITNNTQTRGIEITDSINYGKINFLSNLNVDFNQSDYSNQYSFSYGNIPADETVRVFLIWGIIEVYRTNIRKAFGGFIGFIWQGTADRPLEYLKLRYLLNAEESSNFIGRTSRFLLNSSGEEDTGLTDFSSIATTNPNDRSYRPFNNIKYFLPNDNNTINIHQNELTNLGNNVFNFIYDEIIVDDNGQVINYNELNNYVNINIINNTSEIPYAKYLKYYYEKNSFKDVVLDVNFYNQSISQITIDGATVDNKYYSFENQKIYFDTNYINDLLIKEESFYELRIYYSSNNYVTISLYILEEEAFSNQFMNLLADDYIYNQADNETYLPILLDLNYNYKAVLNRIENVSNEENIRPVNNYQYIGIYSENFFMRKDSIFRLDAEGNRVYLLHDYIFYLTQEDLPGLIKDNYPYGMYAISTSEGRTNGALFPVNINLENIDPLYNNLKDSSWRENISSGRRETINTKFENMRQIGLSRQTTVFNLTLEDINDSENILDNPFVSLRTKEIVYYTNSDTLIANTYKVKDQGYHIAYRANIYSQYYGRDNPLNESIYTARFSPNPNDYTDFGEVVVVAEDDSIIDIYKIRVIVIDAIDLDNPAVKVNGNNTNDFTYLNKELYINNNASVHFKNGVLEITFKTYNLANNYNILDNVKLYNNNSVLINQEYYRLEGGVVEADLFSRDANPYWYGEVVIKLTLSQLLESGRYNLKISFSNDKVYTISFLKRISDENYIYSLNYDGLDQEFKVINFPSGTNNGVINTLIEYGRLLDYTNTINSNGLPTYLNSLVISPFSKLISANLTNYYKNSNGYYVYQISLVIEAENGTQRTWIHTITEKTINKDPYLFTKNGNPVNDGSFLREEVNVFFRIHLDINDIYGGYEYISFVSPVYYCLPGEVEYNVDNDYLSYVSLYIDNSLNFAFSDITNPGNYLFKFKYQRQDIIYFDGLYQEIIWDLDFNDIILTKKQNNNTYLENIIFFGWSEKTKYPKMNCITHNHTDSEITIIQNGIIYSDEIIKEGSNRCDQFNIEGYVSNVNLSYYAPIFSVPLGAKVYRYSESGWTKDLYADFNLAFMEDSYIKYKVVSEDGNFETFYNVRAIDISYNVLFKVKDIIYTTKDSINPLPIPGDLLEELIFISFSNVDVEWDNDFNILFDTFNGLNNRMMSIYYFNKTQGYKSNPFNFNAAGFYNIYVEVPKGYSYRIEITDLKSQQTTTLEDFGYGLNGKVYFVKPSPHASLYEVQIYIYQDALTMPWGFNKIWRMWKR